jgi:preprotein translocase subunit SecE
MNVKTIIYAAGIAGLIVLAVKFRGKIAKFLGEVKTELGKVAWSTRQELMQSTTVVIFITFLMAVFIGAVDLFLSKILSLVFK